MTPDALAAIRARHEYDARMNAISKDAGEQAYADRGVLLDALDHAERLIFETAKALGESHAALDRVAGVTVEEVAQVIFGEIQRQQEDTTPWDAEIIPETVRDGYRAEAAAVLALLAARRAGP